MGFWSFVTLAGRPAPDRALAVAVLACFAVIVWQGFWIRKRGVMWSDVRAAAAEAAARKSADNADNASPK